MEDVKSYIIALLEENDCREIKVGKDNINCSCPIHRPLNNNTSFGINYNDEEHGYPFNCLSPSCGATGNLVTLISSLTGKSYQKSLNVLRKRVKFKTDSLDKIIKELEPTQSKSKTFQESMMPPCSPNQAPMTKYINFRSKEGHRLISCSYIILRYDLYYCSENRYSGRVIMPITMGGSLIGFTNRSIVHDAKIKSLHAPGISQSNCLYGYDQSTRASKIILVEGPFDMFHISSFLKKNTSYSEYGVCALLGTQLSDFKKDLIINTFEEVILYLDDDDAGCEATDKIYEDLYRDIKTSVATTNRCRGDDPCSHTKEEINGALSGLYKRKTLTDFYEREFL